MKDVIPVINCPRGDNECVAAKLTTLRGFTNRVHLDVADARFTHNTSWAEPEVWKKLGQGIELEVHLMVEEPEMLIGGWLDAGAKRVIVHLESLRAAAFRGDALPMSTVLETMKDMCVSRGAVLVLAVNPETSSATLVPLAKTVQDFLLLAVHPGPAGQPFLSLTLGKVHLLRAALPSAHIEVDGGITFETATQVFAAGADAVCAGTFIFSNENPRAAFAALQTAG